MPKSGLRSSKRWTDDLKTSILAFSSDRREPGSECQCFPPVLGSFHPQFDHMLRATRHIAKHKMAGSGRLLSRHKMRGSSQTLPLAENNVEGVRTCSTASFKEEILPCFDFGTSVVFNNPSHPSTRLCPTNSHKPSRTICVIRM